MSEQLKGDCRNLGDLTDAIAYRFGSMEARLTSIEESLSEARDAAIRRDERLELLVQEFRQAIRDLDSRYAPKEGCLRDKVVTRREVAVISTGIGLLINALMLFVTFYFH